MHRRRQPQQRLVALGHADTKQVHFDNTAAQHRDAARRQAACTAADAEFEQERRQWAAALQVPVSHRNASRLPVAFSAQRPAVKQLSPRASPAAMTRTCSSPRAYSQQQHRQQQEQCQHSHHGDEDDPGAQAEDEWDVPPVDLSRGGSARWYTAPPAAAPAAAANPPAAGATAAGAARCAATAAAGGLKGRTPSSPDRQRRPRRRSGRERHLHHHHRADDHRHLPPHFCVAGNKPAAAVTSKITAAATTTTTRERVLAAAVRAALQRRETALKVGRAISAHAQAKLGVAVVDLPSTASTHRRTPTPARARERAQGRAQGRELGWWPGWGQTAEAVDQSRNAAVAMKEEAAAEAEALARRSRRDDPSGRRAAAAKQQNEDKQLAQAGRARRTLCVEVAALAALFICAVTVVATLVTAAVVRSSATLLLPVLFGLGGLMAWPHALLDGVRRLARRGAQRLGGHGPVVVGVAVVLLLGLVDSAMLALVPGKIVRTLISGGLFSAGILTCLLYVESNTAAAATTATATTFSTFWDDAGPGRGEPRLMTDEAEARMVAEQRERHREFVRRIARVEQEARQERVTG